MASAAAASRKRKPQLSDVPETMLWTLHSRANEAMRANGVLTDPKAVEIYHSIDYDFARSFGRAEPTLALRAAAFDEALRSFLQDNPMCSIVNLGEGLETQRYRVPAPGCRWYSIDLPEAMEVRERYITPDEDHTHIALSASDPGWLDMIPRDRPIFISAQGLFMYFDRAAVKTLLQDIAGTFNQCEMIFDVIPRWISRASVLGRGLPRTLSYKTPPMPWGVNRFWLRPLLQSWLNRPLQVRLDNYPPFPRGPARLVNSVSSALPGLQHWSPTIVQLSLSTEQG
ncbi:MAG: class I SAM-dependent methyltransferase [Congregibacter sp.]